MNSNDMGLDYHRDDDGYPAHDDVTGGCLNLVLLVFVVVLIVCGLFLYVMLMV